MCLGGDFTPVRHDVVQTSITHDMNDWSLMWFF